VPPMPVGFVERTAMRVLMVRASGRNAGSVLPELVKRGAAVRALVRSEQRAEVARWSVTSPTGQASPLR
jgi:uncharacterized protein YbjT (DUF2867 family)